MAFTLTVKGAETLEFGKTMISSANLAVDTPDDSMARSTDVAITLHVSGKLLSDEAKNSPTSKLFEWSNTPATSSDAYREVTVSVITNTDELKGAPFREIYLPNAFVVDYSENYSELRGVGEFSIILRQKADKVTDVKVNK